MYTHMCVYLYMCVREYILMYPHFMFSAFLVLVKLDIVFNSGWHSHTHTHVRAHTHTHTHTHTCTLSCRDYKMSWKQKYKYQMIKWKKKTIIKYCIYSAHTHMKIQDIQNHIWVINAKLYIYLYMYKPIIMTMLIWDIFSELYSILKMEWKDRKNLCIRLLLLEFCFESINIQNLF